MKRDCRRNERKWKKYRLTCVLSDLERCHDKLSKAVKEARTSFFSKLILANHSNPQILFEVIESVTCPSSTSSIDASQERCEDFLNYFRNRLSDIKQNITPPDWILQTSRDIHSYFSCFEPVSLPFLMKLISQMKPATCSLDFIPTKFLKEVINTGGSSILIIINSSLKSGIFPHSCKHAVQLLLKKPNLDPSVLNNFRPNSKLPFLSKV